MPLRRRRLWTAVCTLALGLAASATVTDQRTSLLLDTANPAFQQASPARYEAQLETSKGVIVIAVQRDWAPRGADRFFNLARAGYYDDSRFFRVVAERWAQFGIAGDPAVARAWRERTFPDDPPRRSNVKGAVAFAFAVPDGRTTQVFINLRDNRATLDREPFAVFGQVVRGMDVVDSLNAEYGETSRGGIRAGRQAPLFAEGNAYLDRLFPRLDRLIRATVTPQ
jgi:homoserine O-acetyltransferase